MDFVHNFNTISPLWLFLWGVGALLEMYSQPAHSAPAKCQACRRIHNKSVVMGNAVHAETVFSIVNIRCSSKPYTAFH